MYRLSSVSLALLFLRRFVLFLKIEEFIQRNFAEAIFRQRRAEFIADFAIFGQVAPDALGFRFFPDEGVSRQHHAIRADTHAEVDAFYAAAMAAGGTDNGPPGLRPHYHANYYGAFVIDPEGHNLEAVCHTGSQ